MTDIKLSLSAHWREYHGLPPPAGPVIPRYDCDQPSPWLPAVTSAQRAAHAAAALHAEFDHVDDRRTRGTLARQLHLAAAEWQSRHDATLLDGGEPILALMRDLGRLAEPHDPLDQVLGALARSAQGFRRRPMNGAPHKQHLHCFMAPAYRCRCSAPGPKPYPASPADPQTRSSFGRMLGDPGGFWLMQSLLFLKLLHTHLAVRPLALHRTELYDALYKPVLVLLSHLAQGDGPGADTSCALRHVLRRLAPYFCHSDASDASIISPDFDGMPDWFDPRLPDRDGWAPNHASASLAADGACPAAEVQTLTDEVAALALEVASALTDPPMVPALPLKKRDLLQLSSTLLERRKEATERAKKKELPQAFDTPLLLSRMTRLATHFEWVAAHAPGSPGLLPSGSAGPAPGTLIQSTAVAIVVARRNS